MSTFQRFSLPAQSPFEAEMTNHLAWLESNGPRQQFQFNLQITQDIRMPSGQVENKTYGFKLNANLNKALEIIRKHGVKITFYCDSGATEPACLSPLLKSNELHIEVYEKWSNYSSTDNIARLRLGIYRCVFKGAMAVVTAYVFGDPFGYLDNSFDVSAVSNSVASATAGMSIEPFKRGIQPPVNRNLTDEQNEYSEQVELENTITRAEELWVEKLSFSLPVVKKPKRSKIARCPGYLKVPEQPASRRSPGSLFLAGCPKQYGGGFNSLYLFSDRIPGWATKRNRKEYKNLTLLRIFHELSITHKACIVNMLDDVFKSSNPLASRETKITINQGQVDPQTMRPLTRSSKFVDVLKKVLTRYDKVYFARLEDMAFPNSGGVQFYLNNANNFSNNEIMIAWPESLLNAPTTPGTMGNMNYQTSAGSVTMTPNLWWAFAHETYHGYPIYDNEYGSENWLDQNQQPYEPGPDDDMWMLVYEWEINQQGEIVPKLDSSGAPILADQPSYTGNTGRIVLNPSGDGITIGK